MAELNVDEMWGKFCNLLSETVDKYIPKKNMSKKSYPIWMTRKVMKVRNTKCGRDTRKQQVVVIMWNTKEFVTKQLGSIER